MKYTPPKTTTSPPPINAAVPDVRFTKANRRVLDSASSPQMRSKMLPQAEWISAASGRRASSDGSVTTGEPVTQAERTTAASSSSTSPPAPVSSRNRCDSAPENGPAQREVDAVHVHRGSGGLVRGRAVFCLPPDAGWFQGHFAYAARGGCTASLGVLGTELPVDPVKPCSVFWVYVRGTIPEIAC